MAEAVAVPKPGGKAKSGSGKVAFAGVLVFVLLVAFAAAFYFLGGVDLVSGLVNGLFASAPPAQPAQSSSQKPAAPSVAPTASAETSGTGGLKLPEGVDEAFARRVYAEQIESRVNIGKLVAGDVAKFEIGTVTSTDDQADVPIVATFKDDSSAPGTMMLAKKAGKWYLAWVAGERPSTTGGSAVTVATPHDEDSPEHLKATQAIKVDEAVLATMLEQQAANQDIVSAIVAGTYTSFTIDGITPGPGTATLDVTFSGGKAAAMKGRVLCISKGIDGKTQWFITSFSKA